MHNYILRRLAHGIVILVGVNLLTFALFFTVNHPDDMARMHLGTKHVTADAITAWKVARGYDKPLLWNSDAQNLARITETVFFQKSVKLFVFDFGLSDNGRQIGRDIAERIWPSLTITLPAVLFGLLLYVSTALLIVLFRSTYLDTVAVVSCVLLMSISTMFYIIGLQYAVAYGMKVVPISGYAPGISSIKFILLPIFIAIIGEWGASTLWYRTIFLEEIKKDFVQTANAKGLKNSTVLYRHVLRNALIPILTGVVASLPTLFIGSLILESFFSIPGMGSYTIDAIRHQDFSIVRSMVFLGSALYILGLTLTDISYTLVDPRVRLQ